MGTIKSPLLFSFVHIFSGTWGEVFIDAMRDKLRIASECIFSFTT